MRKVSLLVVLAGAVLTVRAQTPAPKPQPPEPTPAFAGQTVAAQGLHDVLLDPQFASNRLIYFTYFAPPKGQEPRNWPIEHFYEEVWTKSLAERRTMQLGYERAA